MVTRAVLFSFHSPWSQRLALPTFQLPRIDVEVKLTKPYCRATMLISTPWRLSRRPICTLGTLANQSAFWFGWVYSNSFRGSGSMSTTSNSILAMAIQKPWHVQRPDLEFPQGGAKKWRQYLALVMAKWKWVEDKGSFAMRRRQRIPVEALVWHAGWATALLECIWTGCQKAFRIKFSLVQYGLHDRNQNGRDV